MNPTCISSVFFTILATASSALASATSIPGPSTFRTEVLPSAMPSATASLAMADNATVAANWTMYERPVLRAKGPKPGDLCDNISPMCYAITHGKRDCWRAWQKYEDDKYYCENTSRHSGACTAQFTCVGGDQKGCFKGSYVKDVFRRIHADGFHCGNGGCGNHYIPADDTPAVTATCSVKLNYCLDCHVWNKDPPTEPLEGYAVVPPPPMPSSMAEAMEAWRDGDQK